VPLEDETFQKGLAALREVSAASYKAAQAKSQDQMLEIADKLTQACSTCHDVFRDKIVDGKPIPIEDRCVK
jgi:cytochrome c556